MVELKAKVLKHHGEDGADIQIESRMEGAGKDLVHESVALIREMMRSLKEENIALYAMVIQELAADPSILRGGDEDEEKHRFAKMMAEMTSRGMFGKGDLN